MNFLKSESAKLELEISKLQTRLTPDIQLKDKNHESVNSLDLNASEKLLSRSIFTLADLEKNPSISLKTYSTIKNKDVKRSYDKEFLISLRSKKESQILPEVLRIFPEIILPFENRYMTRTGLVKCGTVGRKTELMSSSESDSETDSDSDYTTLLVSNENDQPEMRKNDFQVTAMELYERKLFFLLENDANENCFILDKIKMEFDEAEQSSKEFIRALALASCRTCLNYQNGKLILDAGLFKKRIPIITEFVKNEDLQLETLNGIQTFYTRTQRSLEIYRQIVDMTSEVLINKDVLQNWKLKGDGLLFSA